MKRGAASLDIDMDINAQQAAAIRTGMGGVSAGSSSARQQTLPAQNISPEEQDKKDTFIQLRKHKTKVATVVVQGTKTQTSLQKDKHRVANKLKESFGNIITSFAEQGAGPV